MSNQESEASKWLRSLHNGPSEFSDLGNNVALFLDRIWGIHNLNKTSMLKVNWDNNLYIEVVINKPLSTVANDSLTHLVVLAHQMMLRLELNGIGPGYIKMFFYQCTSQNREHGLGSWCPEIHDHVDMILERKAQQG